MEKWKSYALMDHDFVLQLYVGDAGAAARMGCGVCVSQCPQEAIDLVRDPRKGEPLEIQKRIAHAEQLT